MDRDVYGFNVLALHVIEVHVVPMKCEKYSLKSEIFGRKLLFRLILIQLAIDRWQFIMQRIYL